MENIHSVNVYYKGMPIRDIFKISSISDYSVSMKQVADKITSQEDFSRHLLKAPSPMFFEKELKEMMLGERTLFLSVGDAYLESALMKSFPEKEFWITDITDSMMKVICEFSENKKIHPVVSDSRKLSFENNFFDAVIVLGSEYFFNREDFRQMLVEIKRVLKNGGNLGLVSYTVQQMKDYSFKDCLLSLINKSTLLSLIFWFLLRRKICVFSGYRRYLSDFEKEFQKSGLSLKNISFFQGQKENFKRVLFTASKI